MNITFRTDSSAQIGTGHVMRCLTLANALKEQGAHCQFICREHDGHIIEHIERQGFTVHRLANNPDASTIINKSTPTVLAHAAWLGVSQEQDAQECIALLQKQQMDWLVVDHYALDKRWHSQLRPHTQNIMVIDDLADREHDCDLLLDQNYFTNKKTRYCGKIFEHCATLLGPKYALLQPQYAELHTRAPLRTKPVKRMLMFFGGSDLHSLTLRAMQAFTQANTSETILDVVYNPLSIHAEKIKHLAQLHSNIVLHTPQPTLAYLMLQADVAIGAGGATSWERCCLGLPAIVVTVADNQVPIAKELHQLGVINWLGNYQQVTNADITSAINKLILEAGLKQKSTQAKALVDGLGGQRVSGYMLLNNKTKLQARTAQLKDEALLFEWVNDPQVRKAAFNSTTITVKEHKQWFSSVLRNPLQRRIFIIETTANLPIGQVRFDNDNGKWKIDYSLVAPARYKGLGGKLLATAIEALRKVEPDVLVFGEVKEQNIASQKVFEKLGFNKEACKTGWRYSNKIS